MDTQRQRAAVRVFDEGRRRLPGMPTSTLHGAISIGRPSLEASPGSESPECSGVARRKFHPVPVIHTGSGQGPAKGSGFYATDRARKP